MNDSNDDVFSSLGCETAKEWFDRGTLLYKLQRYGEALEAFEGCIRLNPHRAASWNAKGMTLGILQRYGEALEVFEESVRLDPSNALPWSGKGTALNSLQRYGEALAAFEEGTRLDPSNALPWGGKGRALSSLQRYGEALEAFGESIRLDPANALLWSDNGSALHALQRYSEALEAFEKSIRLDPANALLWNSKGNTLNFLQRYVEALEAFEESIRLDPSGAVPWSGKGTALHSLQRHGEALEAFGESIRLDHSDAVSWNGKGNSLYALRRYGEALEVFEECIRLAPSDAAPWSGKGNSLHALRRYGEALAVYDQALRLAPESAPCYFNRAVLKYDMEDSPGAFQDISACLCLNNALTQAWLHACSVALKLGLSAQADRCMQRYLLLAEARTLPECAQRLKNQIITLNRFALVLPTMLKAKILFQASAWQELLQSSLPTLRQLLMHSMACHAFLREKAAGQASVVADTGLPLPPRVNRALGLLYLIYGDRHSALRFFTAWHEQAPHSPEAGYFCYANHCFMHGGFKPTAEDAAGWEFLIAEIKEGLPSHAQEPDTTESAYEALHVSLALLHGNDQDRRLAYELLSRYPAHPPCLVQLAAMAEEDDQPWMHLVEQCLDIEQQYPERAFLTLGEIPVIQKLTGAEGQYEELLLRVAHLQRHVWLEDLWYELVEGEPAPPMIARWRAALQANQCLSAPPSRNADSVPEKILEDGDSDSEEPVGWCLPQGIQFTPHAEVEAIVAMTAASENIRSKKPTPEYGFLLEEVGGKKGEERIAKLDEFADQVGSKDRRTRKRPGDLRRLTLHSYLSGEISLDHAVLYLIFIHAKGGGTPTTFDRHARRVSIFMLASLPAPLIGLPIPGDIAVIRIIAESLVAKLLSHILAGIFPEKLHGDNYIEKVFSAAVEAKSMREFREWRLG